MIGSWLDTVGSSMKRVGIQKSAPILYSSHVELLEYHQSNSDEGDAYCLHDASTDEISYQPGVRTHLSNLTLQTRFDTTGLFRR